MTTVLRYPLVFFDVDSTLVSIEGIDVLGEGHPGIAELTEAAMSGESPIEEVYGRRLEIIRPDRARIEALGATYVESLVPGAEEIMSMLREAGASVHLVTAGIEQAIRPLAAHLGIPSRSLHAVRLELDPSGAWAGFDRRSPLVRAGGKELVVLDVRAREHGRAAFVGDGVSDLEAAGVVDLFIGFGGVRMRPRVREKAGVWIEECNLSALIPHLFEERP